MKLEKNNIGGYTHTHTHKPKNIEVKRARGGGEICFDCKDIVPTFFLLSKRPFNFICFYYPC